jgi:uncharacterized membrane protein (UPF0136 family)
MTTLVILAIMVGAALVVAAVARTRRSRENKEPIQLGVGRKFHS